MDSNNEQNKNIPENLQSSDLDKKYQSDDSSLSNPDSIIKSNLPSFKKILVTYDGKDKSDKAINYSIYLSNLSGAEINILQVIENIDNFENTSLDVSNEKLTDKSMTSPSSNATETKSQDYSVNVEGQIIKSMEDKIKAIENTGFKNKVTYKIRTGWVVDEIVKEINESKYDLLIIPSSHMNSWLESIFSETRKIISRVDLPVLILH